MQKERNTPRPTSSQSRSAELIPRGWRRTHELSPAPLSYHIGRRSSRDRRGGWPRLWRHLRSPQVVATFAGGQDLYADADLDVEGLLAGVKASEGDSPRRGAPGR